MYPQGGAVIMEAEISCSCFYALANKKKSKQMRQLLIKSSILCHESAADGLFNREIKAVQAEYE